MIFTDMNGYSLTILWHSKLLPAPTSAVWEWETEMQVPQLAKGTASAAQNQAKQKEIKRETPSHKCDLRIQSISLSCWKAR